MEGKWTILVGPDGDLWQLDPSDDLSDMADGYVVVPVVPVDGAAVERAAKLLFERYGWARVICDVLAEDILKAAGEVA